MKIGILVAMDKEFDRLKAAVGESGKIGNNTIVLAKSGMGKVNAAVKAVEMIKSESPDCLISTGVAGGLGENVDTMDVVVSRQVAYHDVWCGEGEYGQVQGLPARFDCNKALCEATATIDAAPSKLHCGLIASGDQFISEREQEEKILSNFPDALAVDMESGALAHTCYLYKLPFISFRIISDTLRGENRYSDYENFWENVGDTSFTVIKKFLESLPESL